MSRLLQINNFSKLHDGKNIIFCKTDYILQEFSYIKSLKNDVIFITGNSDYCITDHLASQTPPNIKKWFCQNRLSSNPLLEPIPLGLENSIECKREGHGHVWEHAKVKHKMLSNPPSKKYIEFLFSCFTIDTNPHHRSVLQTISKNESHITWKEPNLDYENYVNEILKHKAIVCAQGNDRGDNHRIYETLYLDRTPLTFNVQQYNYLHHLFPLVLIENNEDLLDKKLIDSKINEARGKKNEKYLNTDYWLEKIYDEAKKHSIAR